MRSDSTLATIPFSSRLCSGHHQPSTFVAGIIKGDEIMVINGAIVSDLDMMFIESVLQEELSLCMMMRSSRTGNFRAIFYFQVFPLKTDLIAYKAEDYFCVPLARRQHAFCH